MSLFGSNLNAILSDFTKIIDKLDNHVAIKTEEIAVKNEAIDKLTEERNLAATELATAQTVAQRVKEFINA